MPYYEFSCLSCEIIFELGTANPIEPAELWCVDCGSNNLKLVSFDQEFSNRISVLIAEVYDITERIENLEYYAEIDNDGLDTVAPKKLTDIKN